VNCGDEVRLSIEWLIHPFYCRRHGTHAVRNAWVRATLVALDQDVAASLSADDARIHHRLIDQLMAEGAKRLLRADEEYALGYAVQAGPAAAAALQSGGLDTQQQAAYEYSVALASQARNALARHNMRLVVSIAHRHLPRAKSVFDGFELEDLVQEGVIGLFTAIDKFDPQRGNRFSTVATWWIRQAISRALEERGRLRRIPVHQNQAMTQYQRAREDLLATSGVEPTDEALCAALNWSPKKLKQTRDLIATAHTDSLHQEMREDEDSQALEHTVGVSEPGYEEVDQQIMAQDLRSALARLPSRERRVLALRYGLEDGEPRTLEEVGQELGITRERVRQIEAEALQRLRHPAIAGKLRQWLEAA
jgi:RNA polymerase primary sigma factor